MPKSSPQAVPPGQSDNYDICIVGLKSYDYLVRSKSPRYLGGIEKDLATLARAFAAEGFSVALLTFDHGQPQVKTIDGVDVYPCYRPDEGVRVLRLLYPRAYRLAKNIAMANATVTIVMGASVLVAWAALACWLHKRRRFAFLAASDSDCEQALPLVSTAHEKVLYKLGLSRADSCFVQNSYQQRALLKNFRIESTILRIPAFEPDAVGSAVKRTDSAGEAVTPGELVIAWIGRLSEEKRPEWILEIAARCEAVSFIVVGGSNTDSPMAKQLIADIDSQRNVVYEGKVAPDEMKNIYARCHYVLNTSRQEGFPAVFREAWFFGVPVISTVDPDSLIEKSHAGLHASNVEQIVEFLQSKVASTSYQQFSHNAANLYESQFSARQCLDAIMSDATSSTQYLPSGIS